MIDARRDTALAIALAVVSTLLIAVATGPLAQGLGLSLSPALTAVVVGLVVIQSLVLIIRRARPRLCLLTVVALQLMIVAVLPSGVTVRLFAPLVAAYTIGLVLRPWARALTWVSAVAVIEVVASALVSAVSRPLRAWLNGPVTESAMPLGDTVITTVLVVVLYGAAAVLGLWVAAQRDNRALLEARAAAERQEQQGRTQRAVEAERRRMARELHDIATHHLTGLVVQAAAVERLVQRDPARAQEATHSLRAQGKEALASLRSVVGVLRDTDADGVALVEAAAGAPAPGLDQLEDLVAKARQLGDGIQVEVSGAPYALAPVSDVNAYRILQESLTNARQHAPGEPVSVTISYGEAHWELTIRNPTSPSKTALSPDRQGFGLIGMRERAQLIGGDLRVGPDSEGSWRVRLSLPRTEPRP